MVPFDQPKPFEQIIHCFAFNILIYIYFYQYSPPTYFFCLAFRHISGNNADYVYT